MSKKKEQVEREIEVEPFVYKGTTHKHIRMGDKVYLDREIARRNPKKPIISDVINLSKDQRDSLIDSWKANRPQTNPTKASFIIVGKIGG